MLDGDTRQALSVVRALGDAGLDAEIGATTAQPLAGYSRYTSRVHALPNPQTDRRAFVAETLALVTRRRFELVIPVTDWTLVPLLDQREALEQHTRLALPSNACVEQTLSKSATVAAARRAGVAVPPTTVLNAAGDPLPDGPWPLVLKTDRSKGWIDNYGWDASAEYAYDEASARSRAETWLTRGPVLAQGYVTGDGVAQAVLAKEGRVLARFQYRRLHEVPISGGASSYRISEAPHAELSALTDALIAELDWTGVAMVETKQTDTGYVLLEVNGRFWGSLALPYHAGVPFAAWLAQLLLDDRTAFPQSYRVGLRARTLAPELAWLKQAIARTGDPQVTALPSAAEITRDTLRLPLDHWDTLSVRDPVPFAVAVARLVGGEARHQITRLRRNRVQREMAAIRADTHGLDARLKGATSVLVVCHGNIVRSAYAHARVRQRTSLNVDSAGLWAHIGTPAHPLARARTHGALTDHRSKPLNDRLLASADLILLMTIGDVLSFRRRYPNRSDALLIGCLTASGPLELADPIDDSRAAFDACFDRIDEVITRLAEAHPAG